MPANEAARADALTRPSVVVTTTAPSRSQPRASSRAAAVIAVRPIRVRASRVCMRMRPMIGIAVIETAVAKKSRKAAGEERPGDSE